MKLSVIIVNFNSLSYLKKCLSTLHWVNLPFNFEIIVVDNGSGDGSREWLKTQSQCKVIFSPENLGFSKGNNLAIQEAEGEFILLLNTDAFPLKGSIEKLIEFLTARSRAGIAGPLLTFPDGRWQRGYNRTPSVRKAWMVLFTDMQNVFYPLVWPVIDALNLTPFVRPKKVGYVDGCCMMIKRAIIEDIGLLDESFFFFAEDAEFCHRARQKGYEVYYVPKARVIHIRGGSSARKDLEKAVILRREAERLFISRTFGNDEWARYSRIMQFNFLIRYQLARILNRPSQTYFSCALKEYKKRD
ncbi:MAG: glycosyltransferase family 2 protein [bacterium]